jgi:hypothetical protein
MVMNPNPWVGIALAFIGMVLTLVGLASDSFAVTIVGVAIVATAFILMLQCRSRAVNQEQQS